MTQPTPALERAARAISDMHDKHGNLPSLGWTFYVEDARAVLASLLPPDEEMVEAKTAALIALAEHGKTTDVQEYLTHGFSGSCPPGALDAMLAAAHSAMIRHAMGEG